MKNDFPATVAWLRRKTQELPLSVGAWLEKIQQTSDKDPQSSQRGYFLQHTFAPLSVAGWVQRGLDIWGRHRYVSAIAGNKAEAADFLQAALSASLVNGQGLVLLAADEAHADTLRQAIADIGYADFCADWSSAQSRTAWQQQAEAQSQQAGGKQEPQPRALPPQLARLLHSASQQMQQLDQWAELAARPCGAALNYADARRRALLMEAELQQAQQKPLDLHCSALLRATAAETQRFFAEIPQIQAESNEQHRLFECLHPRHHQNPNTQGLSLDLAASLERMRQALDGALRDVNAHLYLYENDLEAHYVLFFDERREQLEILREAAQKAEKIHPLFQPSEQDKSRWLGVLSRRLQEWQELQALMLPTLQALQNAERQSGYTPHVFADWQRKDFTVKALLENLQQYEERLMDWYNDKIAGLREEVRYLRVEQLNSSFAATQALSRASRSLQMLTQNINQSAIFRQPLRLDSSRFTEQLLQLESLQTDIESLQKHWTAFEHWHAIAYWRATLPKGLNEMLQQCLSLPNWQAQLQRSYWWQIVQQYEGDKRWINAQRLQQIIDNLRSDEERYTPLLRQFGLDLWQERQTYALTRLLQDSQTLAQAYPLLLLTAQSCADFIEQAGAGGYAAMLSYGGEDIEFGLALAAAQQAVRAHCALFSQPMDSAAISDFWENCWEEGQRVSAQDAPQPLAVEAGNWLPFYPTDLGGSFYRWLKKGESYQHWQEYQIL